MLRLGATNDAISFVPGQVRATTAAGPLAYGGHAGYNRRSLVTERPVAVDAPGRLARENERPGAVDSKGRRRRSADDRSDFTNCLDCLTRGGCADLAP
jgi:hypothetical protein